MDAVDTPRPTGTDSATWTSALKRLRAACEQAVTGHLAEPQTESTNEQERPQARDV